MQTNLNRHVMKLHENEDLVIAAKQSSGTDKLLILEKIRKLGILKFNQTILKSKNGMEKTQRERKNELNENEKSVYCAACLGLFTKSYLSVHQKRCTVSRELSSVSSQPVKTSIMENKFRNNHLVPLLIPKNTMQSMKILATDSVQKCEGIKAENKFISPSMLGSDSHCSGWHSINKVCRAAAVAYPAKLTATKMRNHASTLYDMMDVPEKDQHYFYKHLGHRAEINASIYQAPLAAEEILKVGRSLKKMDGSGG